MERIVEDQINFIRETLIGKRIRARDIIGVCEFFGYNEFFPSWKLQVTIGRLPVTHLELSDIELVD